MIDRRAFAVGFTATITAVAVDVEAAIAQSDRTPVIGLLALGNPDPTPFWARLKEALAKLGYSDGQNIRFEQRTADGIVDRLAAAASDLIDMKIDLIVAYHTPAATAAQRATATVPIVMMTGDPIGTGLVGSLGRPSGNVTGISASSDELIGKKLEFLRELIPSARKVAMLLNTKDRHFGQRLLDAARAAAPALGMTLTEHWITTAEEIESALTRLTQLGAEAVVVQGTLARRDAANYALRHKLPAISNVRQFGWDGGLMTYTPSWEFLSLRMASYVDRILKGAKPADLPVEQSTHFTLSINLKTAKALGLTVPPTLLARVDEVIE